MRDKPKRARYYTRDGKPIRNLLTWARLFEDKNYKQVAVTILEDGTFISTIWIGLDHSFVEIFNDERPPIIFETMVFSPDTYKTKLLGQENEFHDAWDEQRYSTEAEAIIGHDAMVRKWKGIREKWKKMMPRDVDGPSKRNPMEN